MQYFQDSALTPPAGLWAFEDDVVVTSTPGARGKPAVYSFATAAPASLPLAAPATLQPCDAPADPAPADPPAVYIPVWLVRQRLEAANLWDAAVGAMSSPQLAKFCSLELGILPADAAAIELLTAIGADPSAILALP